MEKSIKKNNRWTVQARIASFRYAGEGLYSFFKEQHNARVHLVFTIVIFVAAFIWPMQRLELVLLVLAMGMVWAAEIFNTAIEKMMDHLSPARNPAVKLIKDLAAAAVLVTAIAAATTGLIIFLPKIF